MNDGDRHIVETLREFILEVDEPFLEAVRRRRYSVKLRWHPNYPDADPNGWQCDTYDGVVGFNWSSRERKARDRYATEVVRLRKIERRARNEGRFADARFAIGTFTQDGVRPTP